MVEIKDNGLIADELWELAEKAETMDGISKVEMLLWLSNDIEQTDREEIEKYLGEKAMKLLTKTDRQIVDDIIEQATEKDEDVIMEDLDRDMKGFLGPRNELAVRYYIKSKLNGDLVKDEDPNQNNKDYIERYKKNIFELTQEIDRHYGVAAAYAHDLISEENYMRYVKVKKEYRNILSEIYAKLNDAIKG